MIRKLMALSLAAVVLALVISGTAQTQPALRDNTYINDRLYVAAIADALRDRCPSVEARMGVVRAQGLALFNYALGQGYSRAQISDYLESEDDIDRMKTRRDRYLAAQGAARGDAESHCRVARQEIAAETAIGALLRLR